MFILNKTNIYVFVILRFHIVKHAHDHVIATIREDIPFAIIFAPHHPLFCGTFDHHKSESDIEYE